MPSRRPIPRLLLWPALVASAFAAGAVFAAPSFAGRFNPYGKLNVFTKVLSYIEQNYVEDIAEEDLMYGAARGLTEVLDPHSQFMDPEQYTALRKETEGNEEITGVGVDVERRKNGDVVVVSPIEGSPAARAGVEPGDVIRKINGVEVGAEPADFDEAVRGIQGAPGSEVVMVVERRGKEITFKLKREKVEIKPVEGKLLDDGVAHIKLRFFSATTDGMLADALNDLERKAGGAAALKGIVLDLRRNPGGLLDQAVKVTDEFVSEGLIVTTRGKGGKVMERWNAHGYGTRATVPMIVLVDGASASAAEIVAGALQDHGRAVVMGTQTYGKGSVQTVIDVGGCGAQPCGLKLTVARYYTPSGRSIQTNGITPNVIVEATAPTPDPSEADLLRERDLKKRLKNEQGESAGAAGRKRLTDHQLQTALDYLRSWNVFARQAGKKGA